MPDLKNSFYTLLVAGTVFAGPGTGVVLAADTDLAPAGRGAAIEGSGPDDEATLARGEYIATAADCIACHTSKGGKPFAGGLKVGTPMGDVISTNITPDPEHGIGKYTEQQFDQAVRHGVRDDGSYLYPVMPYVSYAGMTDQDVTALYAWFRHRVKPVAESPPATSLSFPASMRSSMAVWNMFATKETPGQGDSATYNKLKRGEYLANALEHCGTCHTPRNFMLDEKHDRYLAGGPLSGWYAPNITSSVSSGIGNWSEADIIVYLKTGRAQNHAQAAGPMGEAVEHSTSRLTDPDLEALAAWIKQVPAMDDDLEHKPRDSFGQAVNAPDIRTKVPSRIDDLSEMTGPHIFDANCAACHGRNGSGTDDHYAPSLFANSVIGTTRPDNLIMVVLNGVNRTAGKDHAGMPGFGADSQVQRLSDSEIASLVNYVMGTFGSGDPHVTAEKVASFRNK
ncbi:c-type cytochrome [Acetobacter oeni]|uniref:Cytochrome c n=1 Tax=Acetobacter oeni TaxID=304077 RepID=A0A511XL24_9PROT|nr:c-type cytochrome [Acetobacter oeni]MBB3883956.1 mono/diheme cytochrome c family protein [Acetobacter oeni]NHO19960.1 c-type cytochrome [Acetobacter oeni]GBR05752.1 sorbitol dehydrogenase cytochrome c subunit [Acetobacter oeni LMG 21952]GEN63660.1 cytochrome c [Acetobacter oeni]